MPSNSEVSSAEAPPNKGPSDLCRSRVSARTSGQLTCWHHSPRSEGHLFPNPGPASQIQFPGSRPSAAKPKNPAPQILSHNFFTLAPRQRSAAPRLLKPKPNASNYQTKELTLKPLASQICN
mmetsp:Transcript_20766/g.32518  ORF Transcript_20766/g.32518 Transcript_20766/m.32518 type:complete len:122 (+) Transcript_20766:229-594(+)